MPTNKLHHPNIKATAIWKAGIQRRHEWASLAHLAADDARKGLAPSLRIIRRKLATLNRSLADMNTLLNTEYQQARAEVHRLRGDELRREVVMPLLSVLCRSAKRTLRELRDQKQNPSDAPGAGQTTAVLEALVAQQLDELTRHRIVSFTPTAGETFNPQFHEAVREEQRLTENPKLRGRIAEVESPGFTLGGEVLERSTVYLFTAPSAKEV